MVSIIFSYILVFVLVVGLIIDIIRSIRHGETSTYRVNKKPFMTTNKSMDSFGFWMVIVFKIAVVVFLFYLTWKSYIKFVR